MKSKIRIIKTKIFSKCRRMNCLNCSITISPVLQPHPHRYLTQCLLTQPACAFTEGSSRRSPDPSIFVVLDIRNRIAILKLRSPGSSHIILFAARMMPSIQRIYNHFKVQRFLRLFLDWKIYQQNKSCVWSTNLLKSFFPSSITQRKVIILIFAYFLDNARIVI